MTCRSSSFSHRITAPVLFLDFDGVLHRADEPSIGGDGEYQWREQHFCWRAHLETLLISHPNVQIVLSTDWRKYHDDEDLAAFLGDDLGNRLIGVMPIVQNGTRADAIRNEAVLRGMRFWIGLDDHSSVHVASENGDDHFVACHPEQGLDLNETRVELASKLRWLDWLAKQNNMSILPIEQMPKPSNQAMARLVA
ncbi:MAG: HAD domain-containing protein [Azonexus sp.]|nr:HAD domain-containing protein [Azonexus sp.]